MKYAWDRREEGFNISSNLWRGTLIADPEGKTVVAGTTTHFVTLLDFVAPPNFRHHAGNPNNHSLFHVLQFQAPQANEPLFDIVNKP
ncbi:hypothetical protein CEXT_783641 [Caerostris extrusa]|uniref:Uncharacterized protein n=1 Tax=Caerostris extrusa TaxID=172846 RepID=A0AAV4NYW7_CAEEX|nr:hypothetical protein CEXT_783641 [Caerostris extrusa]